MSIVKKWSGLSRKSNEAEISRSQYSLVSCGELSPDALQLWKELPDEVKYDPSLEQFRHLYEREHGHSDTVPLKSTRGSEHKVKRLPLVNSAPHLQGNAGKDLKFDVHNDIQEFEHKEKILEPSSSHRGHSLISQARYYTKMMVMLACWVFFTAIFLMYNEIKPVVMNTSVASGEVKNYVMDVSENQLTVLVKLTGPFLTEQAEGKLNSSQLAKMETMEVWLERWELKSGVEGRVSSQDVLKKEASTGWTIFLQPDDLDFTEGEPRSSRISLTSSETSHNKTVYAIRMKSTSEQTVPFTLSYLANPLDVNTGVIYSSLLLCALYGLIIFEVINRALAAVVVATTSLAILAIAGQRPTVTEVMSWLDEETLILLFSMMVLVAIMTETGMFDYLAVFTFEVTKGKMWPLITLLCAITTFVSTFLDNVTTILLMTPVTIRLCEVTDLDPIPILLSLVLYSNVGGTATPVGDPPNVIIASNKAVIQSGVNFTIFTVHMTLGVIVVCVQTWLQLRYIYRDTNKLRLKVPRDVQELRHQISIWRRAADSLPSLSKDQNVVRERLERKIRKLQVNLHELVRQSNKRACPKETFQSTLLELKEKYHIRDIGLLVKATVAIGFVVAVFFLHSLPELNRISLGWTALLGAILLLLLADREDLEPILHRVEWSTLLFFAALFVLMEALTKLGFIDFIGGVTESIILRVDETYRLAVSILLVLWISGITSAFVDNIPLTTMMIRVVTSLGSNPSLGLPLSPLVWALSFGACLGGNGTLIGASANVVCAGVAEQHGYKFSFMQYLKIGFPVMIGQLTITSIYLMICHCIFTWH